MRPSERRVKIVLNAPAAERVVDAVLLLLTGKVRLGHAVGAVLFPESVSAAAKTDLASGEITFDARRRGRLEHFSVPCVRPLLVPARVTPREPTVPT